MDTNIKRFAFIGNCQMIGLCKYTRSLSIRYKAYWLCMPLYHNLKWTTSEKIFGHEQISHHVFDQSKIKEILQTCDVVVYQPHFESLSMINDNCSLEYQKIIDITPIIVDNKKFMINKEEKYNTTIRASKIIEKYKDKVLHIGRSNHPTTFIYMEILKEICSLLGIDFFSQESYNEIMKIQYPNYKN